MAAGEPSWDAYERLRVVRRIRDLVRARLGLELRFVPRLSAGRPAVASAPIAVLGRRIGLVVAEGDDHRMGPDDARWLQDLVDACAEEATAFDEEGLVGRSGGGGSGDGDGDGAERTEYCGIVGASAPMRRLYELLDKVGPSESTVLVEGDNGTGKELVAKALHELSPRGERGGPFVVTNCSAFNDNLLDSELFGHRRGAFTGAASDKVGLFDVADGGTFFLDEVGDTSPVLQVKLLRVLQEGTFLPVGGVRSHQVDVRVIAATNRDLAAMVREGTFRQDLFYRLHVVLVRLPPLSARHGDVALLVEHFLERRARAVGSAGGGRGGGSGEGRVGQKRLTPEALRLLEAHDWPGNVRELENEIERLVVLSGESPVITDALVSPRVRRGARAAAGRPGDPDGDRGALHGAVEDLERTLILEALRRTSWNKTRAAQALGVSRRNLIRKVKALGLDRRRSP